MFQSYSLLFKKIHGVWDKFGVKPSGAQVGDKFNPDLHQTSEERDAEDEDAPGTVVEILKPGWMYENKVLVKSEVAVVALPTAEASEDSVAEAGVQTEDAESEAGDNTDPS